MQVVIAVMEDPAGQGVLPAAIRALSQAEGIEFVQRFKGAEDPSLARWFSATVDGRDKADALAAHLRTLDTVVDQAFVKGDARPPMLPPETVPELEPGPDPGPGGPTRSLFGEQGYLHAAPEGVSAAAAWDQPGGRGDALRLIDVEIAWDLLHEALLDGAPKLLEGIMGPELADRNHGTSVLGMLAASHDGRGISGICPAATVDVVSMGGSEEATDDATYQAAVRLRPGDILLLELERRSGPETGDPAGYLPVEWWPDEFDVIRSATRRGVIVVEAAGNGSVDLDAPPPDQDPGLEDQINPFLRGDRDSGAIIVGAGAPPSASDASPDRSRLWFSNWGTCVDAQGWGWDVTTAGGYRDGKGDLVGGEDPTRWYTASFNGTSAAAPMVAGALACVQGILGASGLRLLTPLEARRVLRETGSPQVASSEAPLTQRIGSRPDLRALIPFAKRLAAGPPDHHMKSNPRSQGMIRITIEIDDGQVTVAQGAVTADGSRAQTADVNLPHVKGPELGIRDVNGSFRQLGTLEALAQLLRGDPSGGPDGEKSEPLASAS